MSGLGGWAGGGSGGVRVIRAYRFALDPSRAQERALRSHAGAARFAWNWGLAKCQERYAAEGKWYSAADLHRLWNAQKKADPALAWWAQNSKCAYQEAFRDLDRALRGFTASRTGGRKGRRLGFPRFNKRGRCKDSFRFSGVMHCAGSTVTLPPPWHDRHARADPQAGPQAGERDRPDPAGHSVADRAAVVRVVHRRG
jgi:putative transposase